MQAETMPEECVIDTGATVSAGGRKAVNDLVSSLAKARSDLNVQIFSGDRPYFRYGSGDWGRALFRVRLMFSSFSLDIYALPSPGVPVLLGMRELSALQCVLNLSNGHAIIAGSQVKLRTTHKRHLVLNMIRDLPGGSRSKFSTEDKVTFSDRQPTTDPQGKGSDGQFSGMLELLTMRDDFHSISMQHDSHYLDAKAHEHVDLSPCDFSFLLGHCSSDPNTSSVPEISQSPSPAPRHVDRVKGCQDHDQGGGSRSPGRRKAEDQGHVIHFGEDARQKGEEDTLRRVSSIRDAISRTRGPRRLNGHVTENITRPGEATASECGAIARSVEFEWVMFQLWAVLQPQCIKIFRQQSPRRWPIFAATAINLKRWITSW